MIAWKASYDGRQRVLTEVLSGITDDRGEYEIIWLPPGKYYVSAYVADAIDALGYRANFGRSAPPGSAGTINAAPQYLNPDGDTDSQSLYLEQVSPRQVLNRPIGGGSETVMHAAMSFPNTLDSQAATAVDVQSGGEARAINIDSPAMPVQRIRGTLTGSPSPVLNARGGVISPRIDDLIHVASGKRTTVQPNQQGTFEFSRLFPGQYVVHAGLGDLTGRAEVEIRDGDVDVSVSLASGLRISGKIRIEPPLQPTGAVTGIRALNVLLRPIHGSRAPSTTPFRAHKRMGWRMF